MSTVPSLTGNTNDFAQYGLAATQKARSTALGQADFLKLMTEQLKNQDPLKPLEGAQFLGQLAQFSTVQGIDKMQGAMNAMASVMESDQTLRAAGLVGREALVDASSLDLASGAGVRGEIGATTAGPIALEVVDASGQVVRRTSVQAASAGNVPFAWDGKDDAGNPTGAGRYTVRALSGVGESAQQLDVRVAARVDSVSIESTGLVLNLAGLGRHPMGAVKRLG